jgi:hypothetical protein
VDDPVLVRRLEGFGHLAGDIERDREGHRAVNVFALDEFQHEVVGFGGGFQPVDRGDVGMVQRGEHPCLAPEAPQAGRVSRELGGQRLDGDIAAQPSIVRPVHLAHAPGADEGEDPICAVLPAGRRLEVAERTRNALDGGPLEEAPRLLVIRDERVDQVPQLGVLRARQIEKRPARLRGPLERGVEDVFGPLPESVLHRRRPGRKDRNGCAADCSTGDSGACPTENSKRLAFIALRLGVRYPGDPDDRARIPPLRRA